MSKYPSSIRTLMELRKSADQRNVAVEAASNAGGWSNAEWAPASKVWSRQSEALTMAVIGEPPTDLADVLSVLSCLAQVRYQHADEDEPTASDTRAIDEMTNIAILNCIVAVANTDGPSLRAEEDLEWIVSQVAYWLPAHTPRSEETAHG